MATIQTINRGTVPNDQTGDTLYDAGGKINDNFEELDSAKLEAVSTDATMTGNGTPASPLSVVSSEIKLNVDLDSAEANVTRTVTGGRTIFEITHNLNTLDLITDVFRLSDGRSINWRIERTSLNIIEASRAGNVGNGLFRILIQG